jgi:hypothetical protein
VQKVSQELTSLEIEAIFQKISMMNLYSFEIGWKPLIPLVSNSSSSSIQFTTIDQTNPQLCDSPFFLPTLPLQFKLAFTLETAIRLIRISAFFINSSDI